jgi:cobalamin transport system substrate-binding protein
MNKKNFSLFLHHPSSFILHPFIFVALICSMASCASRKEPAEHLRVITDELGRTVRVKPHPERIVSLAPSITETLFALGLADRVVGVTTFCDYPPEAAQKEKVGDTLRPNLERIVALKADLAIVSTASQLESFISRLEEVGIPVYISNPRNLDRVLDSTERIAELADAAESGSQLVKTLRARIDAIENKVAGRSRPNVFLLLGSEPLITAGGGAFITDLINRAGGRSISADEKADYPQYSLETVIARQPDIIFLQAGEAALPRVLEQTSAARAGRVYHINDDLLLRPGPRIVEGLEQMAQKIHPN